MLYSEQKSDMSVWQQSILRENNMTQSKPSHQNSVNCSGVPDQAVQSLSPEDSGNGKHYPIRTEILLFKILNTTSTCIFWKDTERRFIGVNQAFLDYYGFTSEEELIGKTDEDMGWHSDPDPFTNDEWRVLKKGESTFRVHGKCIARGEERDILASKSPIYEDGKVIGLVGTFEDVTNDYRQRDEIRKLTETISNIPCGICICRMRFDRIVCVSVNTFFTDMIGKAPADFENHDFDDFADCIHPADAEEWKRAADALAEGTAAADRYMDGIYRFRQQDTGEYVWLRMKGRKARLLNDEEFLYFTFTDESELKNSETRENALRQMYASSVEAANLVVWEYDISTHTVTFDRNGYTATRCKELGIPLVFHNVPESLYPIIPEQYHEELRRFYDAVFSGQAYATADIAFKPRQDQTPLFLHLSYTTILDNDGRPLRAYGTSQDKSREKIAEMQYAHEISSLNAIDKKTFIAKGHHDLNANRIIGYHRASIAIMDVTGMTYDDAYRELKKSFYYESDLVRYTDLFSRENLISRFRNGETYFSIEYRRKGGIYSAMWVFMEVKTFCNPASGNIECFIYSYDITGRQIRQQLSDNLRSLGYESVGFINVPDRSATYYHLPDQGMDWIISEALVSYEENALQKIRAHVLREEQDEILERSRLRNIMDALDTAGSCTFSFSYVSEGQSTTRKCLRYGYLPSDRNIVTVSVQDITEQYRKEQEQIALLREANRKGEAANRAKTDFLSRMSHDIRTPLNGIIGMTYLTKQLELPEKARTNLDKIDISSKFLLGLVNDILDMSKIESKKLELHPAPYSQEKFLGYVNAVIRPLCEEKKQNLTLDLREAGPFVPLMDELRINQIFFNLLSNAVKYTQEGGNITLKLEEQKTEAGRLRLAADVIDNGIGMSRKLQETAFEPFSQGERSDTTASRGTGLGLPIVKSLVERMGGTVSVESTPGKGSDFHVQLEFDCVPADSLQHKDAERISAGRSVSLKNKRVLICEDHPLNQEIVRTLLENRGMIVCMAENGQAGTEIFRRSAVGSYDLILMDIHMPVMDGYQAARAIRAMDRPDAGSVPVIAMTADAFAEDIRRCLDAGMNDHIAKPIEPDNLYKTIAAWLTRSAPEV